eukprot:CAMPEP_0170494854 /NCGR_PEP_ID=MMETSP0208-20121228/14875_1 /TAXON_ID=197538 /ORGANISM="Strombidium inclinatum, Strain S3" /LENGTH=318 /DNA_ID=CAMNT_0010770963 /DNA_START=1186 /DNA_END=2141 /DNA_ORIENTATION=+
MTTLLLAVFDSDDYLEGELLESGDVASEVVGVLKDGDPDAHGVLLHQTVQLVHVQSVVNVPLKPHDVVDASTLLPVGHFGVQPPVTLQDLEALLATQELGDEDVHVCRVHQARAPLRLLGPKTGFLFPPELVALHLDDVLDLLRFHQEVDGLLVKERFLKHAQGSSLDVFVANKQEVAEVRETPLVEVKVALAIELAVGLDDALGQVGGTFVAPVLQEIPHRAVGHDAEVKGVQDDLQQVIVVPVPVDEALEVTKDAFVLLPGLRHSELILILARRLRDLSNEVLRLGEQAEPADEFAEHRLVDAELREEPLVRLKCL